MTQSTPRPLNILVLCTGNSARSILAEALFSTIDPKRFRGFSAGSHPKSEPNPFALANLKALGLDTSHVRSKSWNEFATPGAPPMDIIVTVCDDAAGESCPYWPGHPVVAHWGIPDPAAVTGTDMKSAPPSIWPFAASTPVSAPSQPSRSSNSSPTPPN